MGFVCKTYSGNSQVSVVEGDGLNLNQDISLAELGERNVFLENNPVKAVLADFADRPRACLRRKGHRDEI